MQIGIYAQCPVQNFEDVLYIVTRGRNACEVMQSNTPASATRNLPSGGKIITLHDLIYA